MCGWREDNYYLDYNMSHRSLVSILYQEVVDQGKRNERGYAAIF